MFHCNHCHTEYGGIRGISAEKCPRCAAADGTATQRRPETSITASSATWLGLQELVSSRRPPVSLAR